MKGVGSPASSDGDRGAGQPEDDVDAGDDAQNQVDDTDEAELNE